MHTSARRADSGSASNRGPAMFVGFCRRSRQLRMMDLPDFMDNMQAGWSQMVNDGSTSMQRMWSGGGTSPGAWTGSAMAPAGAAWTRKGGCGCGCGGDCGCGKGGSDCGCGCGGKQNCTCHCECCVCDADVLVHARCGEIRRIPLTFENDTRRDKPVVLTLEKFVSAGGRDLGWTARLSETQFTLHPCDEHTVSLLVQIKCKADTPTTPTPGENPNTPGTSTIPGVPTTNVNAGVGVAATRDDIFGSVDKCEVAYATIRAEGCLTRPIVVAVAVLPDDCDAFRHPCGCGCCCND
jgi:hypothetical protein